MSEREVYGESRKTISIEEYLIKRRKKQENDNNEQQEGKEKSSARVWAELYI